MDLKNMTMDDLKQKLSGIDKKTLIKFGIGVGAVILFLIIYYVILSPMVKERRAIFDDKILKCFSFFLCNHIFSVWKKVDIFYCSYKFIITKYI